jgi:hypothetical protein
MAVLAPPVVNAFPAELPSIVLPPEVPCPAPRFMSLTVTIPVIFVPLIVGVTIIGEVIYGKSDRTLSPVPVLVIAPVPPDPTAKDPSKTIGPVDAVLGVNPVLPALKDVTPPPPPPAGVAQVPSPRQNVVALALVPLLSLATAKLPVA